MSKENVCPHCFDEFASPLGLSEHYRESDCGTDLGEPVKIPDWMKDAEEAKKHLAQCEYNFDSLQVVHEKVCKERDEARAECEKWKERYIAEPTIPRDVFEKVTAAMSYGVSIARENGYDVEDNDVNLDLDFIRYRCICTALALLRELKEKNAKP